MLHQRIPVPGRATAVLDIYVQQNDTELEMIRWKKRPAILILPGGGYNMVADREGEPYALRYMGIGFQAFVLTYTVKADFDTTLADAAAAMKLIRDNAEAWHVDPEKIAVAGSSAGGNLAMWLAARTRPGEPPIPQIDADPVSLHPNALVLCYPAVQAWSRNHLFFNTAPEGDLFTRVDGMPPSFLWATQGDELVPVEHLLRYACMLNAAHVPMEMHVYQHGVHGYATADIATGRVDPHIATWLPLSIEWLIDLFDLA